MIMNSINSHKHLMLIHSYLCSNIMLLLQRG
uniref:Hypotheticial protein n=1 Tax=Schistosoma japonicum TaxID=6182 RepID=C1LA67_SCHJA|nr:hypotheticial protein [Schistosoma japonicum]